MKTFTSLALFLLIGTLLSAQAPQAISYQAVARGNGGQLLFNANVSVRFSILSGNANGAVVYQETHATTTNQYGLFSLNLGNGTPVIGSLASINWGSNAFFLKVEMDPAGGGNYTFLNTSQLMSVPYALYAEKTTILPGTGINVQGQTVAAQNAAALWNANQLQGHNVSNTAPQVGQFLKWDGSAWAPADNPAGTGSGSNAATLIYTLDGF